MFLFFKFRFLEGEVLQAVPLGCAPVPLGTVLTLKLKSYSWQSDFFNNYILKSVLFSTEGNL